MVVMFPDAYKGLCPLMHCCFISFAVEQLSFLALIDSFCSFGMVFLVVSEGKPKLPSMFQISALFLSLNFVFDVRVLRLKLGKTFDDLASLI